MSGKKLPPHLAGETLLNAADALRKAAEKHYPEVVSEWTEGEMSECDLVEEIWKHRDDPDEWGEEAEEIQVRPSRSSVVSFRLPPEEFVMLERAAAQNEESVSQYIRGALALRMHGDTPT